MKKKLAIKGHATRGKEVIKLLGIMGGCSTFTYGFYENRFYFIGDNGWVYWNYNGPEEIDRYKIFTLEEFLEKYPFQVGDRVFDIADGDPGIILVMKWDEDVSDMEYYIAFDNGDMGWYTNDMIEFLKEDNKEINGNIESNQCKVNGLKRGDEYPIMEGVECNECIKYYFPDGYEFVDTDDTGVYLKPIKSKYPTTYDECCDMLNANEFVGYELMTNFPKLINARNAYWKIAGKEMGLDKPWEPEYSSLKDNTYFTIQTFYGEIDKSATSHRNTILVFPTEEMRDAFYENFKDLIEQCKEFL